MSSMTVVDDSRPDLGGNYRGGDTACFTPVLWEFLINRFGVNSLLDVGCGEGYAVNFFRRHGVIAHGIEGLMTNVRNAVTPIALHDIKASPFIMPVDMVLCARSSNTSKKPICPISLVLCATGGSW
ncbi:MAG: hypothetical protein HC888_06185 [Candidatus Competibacteraceae bacterium]|nr:hypothetical protein [Candidatus Competibacteraceae bacterium]